MSSICANYLTTSVSTLIHPQHQYFSSQRKFEPTCRMTPSRQLEYFNTLIPKNPLSLQDMTGCLRESKEGKGRVLVKRKRNCGVFVGERVMVFGWDQSIRAIEIEMQMGQREEGQQEKRADFKINHRLETQTEGQIMQILNFGLDDQILVRELYRLTIFDKFQTKYRYLSEHQITNSIASPFSPSSIFLTTYIPHTQTTTLLRYPVGEKPTSLISISKYLIALQQINRESLITATYDTIKLYDQRTKVETIFYTEKQRVERRILDLVWLRTQMEDTPYFVVGNSSYVEVFDIRNGKGSIGEHKHWCEDSPPINYMVFQNNNRTSSIESLFENTGERKKGKILVGGSPNPFGNSLFFTLQDSLFSSPNKIHDISCERYMAALSEQKRYFGSKSLTQSLYNYSNAESGEQSVSLIPHWFGDTLAFFHGGSNGNLKVELFDKNYKRILIKNPQKQKYRIENYFETMQEMRFIQKHNSVKQEQGEQDPDFKINYAIYRCISDSDLRQFKDELFRKSGLGEVDLRNDGVFMPPPVVIDKQSLKSNDNGIRKGRVDDKFIDELIEEW